MRKLIALVLVALGLTGSFTSTRAAHADTIADNFNTATLDSNWGVFGGSNYAVSTGANGLTIQYSSTSPNPAGTDGGVFSTFEFDGNFTVRVAEDISGMPVVNAPFVFVNGGPLASEQNASSFVGPFNSPGPTTQGSVFENGVYIGGQNYNLSSEVNTILIQRVGDTIFELIAPSGSKQFYSDLFSIRSDFLGPTNLDLGLFCSGRESRFQCVSRLSQSLHRLRRRSLASIRRLRSNRRNGQRPGGASGTVRRRDHWLHRTGGAPGLLQVPLERWRVQSVANLVGADPSSTYDFELLGGPGGSAVLDSADYFEGTIFYNDLAAGDYAIGISATSAQDPTYYIDFTTPVAGAVPEPSTWAMMLVGVSGLGLLVLLAQAATRVWLAGHKEANEGELTSGLRPAPGAKGAGRRNQYERRRGVAPRSRLPCQQSVRPQGPQPGEKVGTGLCDRRPSMRVPYIASVCICLFFVSSISEAAKMGHHPWEVQTSWEDWNTLTYPQKCVHVATPKIHQYATWIPTGKPDPAAVAACQQVMSDAAIRCLRSESKSGSDRYTSFKAAAMRVFPALTATQVKACANVR